MHGFRGYGNTLGIGPGSGLALSDGRVPSVAIGGTHLFLFRDGLNFGFFETIFSTWDFKASNSDLSSPSISTHSFEIEALSVAIDLLHQAQIYYKSVHHWAHRKVTPKKQQKMSKDLINRNRCSFSKQPKLCFPFAWRGLGYCEWLDALTLSQLLNHISYTVCHQLCCCVFYNLGMSDGLSHGVAY